MTELKKTSTLISSTIITLSLATAGFVGINSIDKCLMASVDIEYKDNRFCGTVAELEGNKTLSLQRLKTNSIKTPEEAALVQLMLRNDPEFANEVKNTLIAKYDPDRKAFDGSQFDSDVILQMQLLIDIADQKCNGQCSFDSENLSEEIINLLKS